jgi:hypothetical protein
MQDTLEAWLSYRDHVAQAVGLVRGMDGCPELAVAEAE